MAKAKPKTKPAISPEAQEKKLINDAYRLAEQQINDGTASPSIITHFLKLGQKKYDMENELLKAQVDLAQVKIKNLESQLDNESLHKEALAAMTDYKGSE